MTQEKHNSFPLVVRVFYTRLLRIITWQNNLKIDIVSIIYIILDILLSIGTIWKLTDRIGTVICSVKANICA